MEQQRINGRCLCGNIQFSIQGNHLGIYQCHCSECRKITGSSGNSSCVIPTERFTWINGKSNISSYMHESGYRSDFCSQCGSPAPNIMKNGSFYWVPAGALEDTGHTEVVAHLCVASRARWDSVPDQGVHFETVPTLEELVAVLHTPK